MHIEHQILRTMARDRTTEKKQFRLCASCRNEIKHCSGLRLELDVTVERYTLTGWLRTLSDMSALNRRNGDCADDLTSLEASITDLKVCI